MSLVYRNALLYEAVMVALYGRHYAARYETVANLIPPRATVLDLCCGPAILFDRYLRHKSVSYTGLDLSETFVARLRAQGGTARVWNLHDSTALPEAEYVVMHASLYHFFPDPEPVFARMLRAAQKQLIIAEPVRNMASSKNWVVAAIGRHFTDPGDGHSAHRFTEETLDRFVVPYRSQVETSFLIPGGREKVFVFNALSS